MEPKVLSLELGSIFRILKKRYLLGGYIQQEYQALIKMLKVFLKASKVRARYASGVEKVVHYEDDVWDIYISEYFDKGFLLDASFSGNPEDFDDFIEKIKIKLQEDNVPYQFEWNEVDENGDQTGEEYEIRYP